MQRVINRADQVVEDMLGRLPARAPGDGRRDGEPSSAPPPRPPRRRQGRPRDGRWIRPRARLPRLSRPNLLDAVAIGEIFTSPSASSLPGRLPCCRRWRRGRLPLRQLRRRQHERQAGHANGGGRGHSGSRRSWRTTTFPPAPASEDREAPRCRRRDPDVEGRGREGGSRCAARRGRGGGPAHDRPDAKRRHRTDAVHDPSGRATPTSRSRPGTMEVGIGHHGEPGVAVETLPQRARWRRG